MFSRERFGLGDVLEDRARAFTKGGARVGQRELARRAVE